MSTDNLEEPPNSDNVQSSLSLESFGLEGESRSNLILSSYIGVINNSFRLHETRRDETISVDVLAQAVLSHCEIAPVRSRAS